MKYGIGKKLIITVTVIVVVISIAAFIKLAYYEFLRVLY
jgi:hypothetical protein